MNNDNAAAIVRGAMGTSLIGVKGATPQDQEGIDDTMAGACAVKAFTTTECARHTK